MGVLAAAVACSPELDAAACLAQMQGAEGSFRRPEECPSLCKDTGQGDPSAAPELIRASRAEVQDSHRAVGRQHRRGLPCGGISRGGKRDGAQRADCDGSAAATACRAAFTTFTTGIRAYLKPIIRTLYFFQLVQT